MRITLTPIDYVIALLRNENPYSFHIWYLQTLFLFISLTFLFDRQVEDEHKQRLVKIILILLLPAFMNGFVQNGSGHSRIFQKYQFFLLGTILPEMFLEKRKIF